MDFMLKMMIVNPVLIIVRAVIQLNALNVTLAIIY